MDKTMMENFDKLEPIDKMIFYLYHPDELNNMQSLKSALLEVMTYIVNNDQRKEN